MASEETIDEGTLVRNFNYLAQFLQDHNVTLRFQPGHDALTKGDVLADMRGRSVYTFPVAAIAQKETMKNIAENHRWYATGIASEKNPLCAASELFKQLSQPGTVVQIYAEGAASEVFEDDIGSNDFELECWNEVGKKFIPFKPRP